MGLIQLNKVSKIYKTEAGDFLALKNINLEVEGGEFVAVIGKSGSGKSTLINMLTGIDRPTKGEVEVAGTAIHGLDESRMAEWRGRNMGIVFQFFQLLPTLTVLENVMLPMDLGRMYVTREREKRALKLLEMVEISADQADKLPSQLSGGQQQRVAIARAMANDPPIIAADEPTGNLDSKTASLIFELFGRLVDEGKTIMMVTHDRDLAKRVQRTLVIADGAIIEEYLARTFPGLTERQLVWITAQLERKRFKPGEEIIKKGEPIEMLHIVTRGAVEIIIEPADGRRFVVAEFEKGQYFGEIELMRGGGKSLATARASLVTGAEVATLDQVAFKKLLAESEKVRKQVGEVARKRYEEHRSKKGR